MAAHVHNPSRRALLGAAVALPLVGADTRHCEERSDAAIQCRPGCAGAACPAGRSHVRGTWQPAHLRCARNDDGEWNRLLEAYRAAEAVAREAEGDSAREEEYGDRLGLMYAALRRLLCLPAPGLGAFALKVVLAIDQELGTLAGGGPCLAAIRREAVRLAAEQSSNILFPPDPAIPK